MARWATFQANDGALYYVAEMDDGTVGWFGEWGSWDMSFSLGFEHRAFANVFLGTRSGSTVEGRFVDVPKGRTRGAGTLRLDFPAGASEFRRLSGPFGGTEFRQVGDSERTTAAFMRPEYSGTDFDDLTGTWLCDDGGTYYVRQTGEEVHWYGEHPNASFANVFSGTIKIEEHATTVSGRWFDVHKGEGGASGSGTLELHRDRFGEALHTRTPMDGGSLSRQSGTGGFGGSIWRKVDAGALVCTLDKLTIVRTNESGGDEPYVWPFFVKVDGDTVDILDVSAADISFDLRYGEEEDLSRREDVRAGTSLAIPSKLGRFASHLKTFRGLNPASPITPNAAVFAVGLIAIESDRSGARTVRAGFRTTYRTTADELRQLTRRTLRDLVAEATTGATISPSELLTRLSSQLDQLKRRVRQAVDSETRSTALRNLDLGSGIDSDDNIGTQMKIFTLSQLRNARTTPFEFQLEGDDAVYRVNGRIDCD